MARAGKVDFGELKKFAENIKDGSAKVDLFIEALTKELGERLLAKTVKRTPVDTSTLKKNWKITAVEKTGGQYVITVYNNTEYSAYVEYGHRTANHKGWVPGRFMLTISADEIDNMAPTLIERRVKAFVREVMNGD